MHDRKPVQRARLRESGLERSLLSHEAMPRFVRRTAVLLSKVVIALAVVVVASRAFDDEVVRPSGPGELRPTSATVSFERDEVALEPDAAAALDAIAERAMTSLSVRILVVGFANERDTLQENLALAERRARAVAHYLGSRAVSDHAMVIAGVEAARDDRDGARCEVELVDAHERTPSARRLLGPTADAQARSALSSLAVR